MSPLHAVIVLAVLLFAGWVYSEFKQHRAARIVLGISCLASIVLGSALSSFRAGMIQSHEWVHLNASMSRLERVLDEGDVAGAKSAIAAYNTVLQSTADPYESSVALWQNLPQRSTER